MTTIDARFADMLHATLAGNLFERAALASWVRRGEPLGRGERDLLRWAGFPCPEHEGKLSDTERYFVAELIARHVASNRDANRPFGTKTYDSATQLRAGLEYEERRADAKHGAGKAIKADILSRHPLVDGKTLETWITQAKRALVDVETHLRARGAQAEADRPAREAENRHRATLLVEDADGQMAPPQPLLEPKFPKDDEAWRALARAQLRAMIGKS